VNGPAADGDQYLRSLYSLDGQTAVVTGGTGVLGSAIAMALAMAGAKVGVLGRRRDVAEERAAQIKKRGGEAMAIPADVLDRPSLIAARELVIREWGGLQVLVNAAGGNTKAATIAEGSDPFAMSEAAFRDVVDLNLTGTLLPSLVFGEAMVSSGGGAIVNISSMSASRALTRVAGYGAAKAGVESLTRSLAVELGQRYGDSIRVNAIAPGFFIGEQNRSLLLQEDGSFTRRGEAIIAQTPAKRFGAPEDLMGAVVWLCGPGARFVNGVVIPIDGGFSAFSGI
jgi:NAD(P)-dependent dehydrogenase (short-subunit alcohol dehydrogenase family)